MQSVVHKMSVTTHASDFTQNHKRIQSCTNITNNDRTFYTILILFLQIGHKIRNDDCSKEYTCEADGTFSELPTPGCHEFGKCKRGRCKCKRGYEGDGVTSCTSMYATLTNIFSFTFLVLCLFGTLITIIRSMKQIQNEMLASTILTKC